MYSFLFLPYKIKHLFPFIYFFNLSVHFRVPFLHYFNEKFVQLWLNNGNKKKRKLISTELWHVNFPVHPTSPPTPKSHHPTNPLTYLTNMQMRCIIKICYKYICIFPVRSAMHHFVHFILRFVFSGIFKQTNAQVKAVSLAWNMKTCHLV